MNLSMEFSRAKGEGIAIGKDIKITVLEVRGGKVRLGIIGPRDTIIRCVEVSETTCEPTGHHPPTIQKISAVSLATHDMARAVRFYRALGFDLLYGGEEAPFTSFRAGSSYLNLLVQAAGRKAER